MRRAGLVVLMSMLAACGGGASGPSQQALPADSTSPSSTPTTAAPSTAASTTSPTPSASPTATATPRVLHYFFPVSRCSASPSSSHHDYPAADIFTKKGCRFVAVV